MSVFYNDTRQVTVSEGSDYYDALNCGETMVNGVCEVDVTEYVDAFFGGTDGAAAMNAFSRDHIMRNAIILGGILLLVRLSTFIALRCLTYSGK